MINTLVQPTSQYADIDGLPMLPPILCFSHLRWNFVWQRPQQIMSRFARSRPVYFVEEPIASAETRIASLAVTSDAGVTILTPHVPHGFAPGFGSHVNGIIQKLLETHLAGRLSHAVIWYETPMALGAAPRTITPDLVVFDVMDELANFRYAPAEITKLDSALINQADLVFTGGPSLYRRRADQHPRVYCFTSGVDQVHFAAPQSEPPLDMDGFEGPVIGFYGVLDERIDFALLNELAILRPTWNIVLVGPMAKITEEDLAHQPNIFYLGLRSYAELPSYLARFDCAILPFALNESTTFISPTKTLEYLAGGKPVVSTAIRDVVDLYGSVVDIAGTAAEFVRAIEASWAERGDAARNREHHVADILRHYDWDAIVGRMDHAMQEHQDRVVHSPMVTRQRQSHSPLHAQTGARWEAVSNEASLD